MLDLLGVEILDPKCRYEEGNLPWIPPIVTVGIPLSAEGDKLHHKFAVIDGKKVIFGSHNWSEAANKNNDETLLVIEDSKIAYEFTKEVNRLSQKAILGVPNWLKKRIMERETACRKPNSKY
jgi:phosphatidylserine/phosphatidylglycerophosphate/cardiolipin synthase-like enzyme